MRIALNPSLLIAVIVLVILPMGNTLTGPMLLSANNRYINISTYIFNSGGTVNCNACSYTLNYYYTQPNVLYRAGITISNLNFMIPPSRALYYNVKATGKTLTGDTIYVYSNTANKITQLVVNLVIIQSGFLDLPFIYYTFTYGSTILAGQSKTNTDTFSPSMPLSASIYQSLVGIDLVASDNSMQIGFQFKFTITTPTSVDFKLTSLSSKSITLNTVVMLVYIYSNSQLSPLIPKGQYILSQFTGINGTNSALAWSNPYIRTYNTMVGLTTFYIKGQTWFNYNIAINNGVSVTANSNNTWLKLSFCINVFTFLYCPDTIPYLLVSQNLCYDICPARYYTNYRDFECGPCPFDCYTCNDNGNGSCTSCNGTTDFRYMNNATLRCIPLPGYYNTGVTVAVACVNTSCLTCTSATVCLSCYPGKFLSGTTCISCIANCANCTTSTTCVICNTYYKVSGTTCVPNCTLITNCLTCNVSTTLNCLTCATGYTTFNNTCIVFCGDGILISPETCDDNNTAAGDGCSSTCTVQPSYYCNTAVSPTQCTHCIANCDNCSTTTTCTVCSIGYLIVNSTCVADCSSIQYCATCNYNATLAGPQCLTAQTGYYVLPNNTCASTCGDGIRVPSQGCDDGNTTSGDGCSATCTVQSGYYCVDTFPNASVCSACMPFCALCTNNATCSNCSTAYLYNSTQNACIIDCTVIAQCLTCNYSGTTQCQTCTIGYHINIANNSCDTQCGDGIRVASQGCDDNNTNATDGCSPTCAIQSGFYCIDTFPNASVCSACIPFCTLCTNNNSCSNCSTYYSYNSTQNACIIDCTVVAQCLTCDYNGTTRCLTCATGYHINSANNSCDTQCGDGIRVSSQGCDDNNTNSTDGCSSTCTIQSGFFCVDTFPNASVCSACIPFCTLCTNNASCSNCSTAYTYNNTQNACIIDCSVVAQCATCGYNGTTQCLTCNTGYHVNSANNSCDTLCGDGVRIGSQACDDNNTNSTDGCSSTCTVEAGYFCVDTFPNASTCWQCLSNCALCSSNTSCTNCSTGYTYNTSQLACTIDCSPIVLCLTCGYNGTTQCLTCDPGYHVNNATNTCQIQCGDGFKMVSEACDDGNNASNDGCSSNCTTQAGFFCVDTNVTGGVKSSCTACLSFCINCTSATTCGTCQANYTFNSTICVVDCTPISLCLTCNFTTSLNCMSCTTGYYPTSNVCQPNCGDGIVVTSQACDDGNTNNNDGCSSTCILQQAFLCSNATVNGSLKTTCSPCLTNCIDCTGDINDCQACKTGYLYNSSGLTITCDVDCGSFTDCTACTFTACTACLPRFTLDGSANCVPICGDGNVMMAEICDDGNTGNGDGCSSTCQVQTNFACVVFGTISECSLLSMSISFVSLMKSPSSNSFDISYQMTPSTLPAFSTLDWSTVVSQQSNLSVTFTSYTFDSSTGQLSISTSYSQPLDASLLQLGFSFPPTAPFNMLNGTTNTSTVLVADNNMKLDVYSDEQYGQAKMVGYAAMGLSILAAILFLLGYYSGKLIGLQCVTVFQLAFLSLLTCDKLAPSFTGLSYLAYSCGYNINSLQKAAVKIEKKFSSVGYSQPFIDNYNITAVLFLLPLVLSLVFALINRFCYKSANRFLIKHSQLLRGEGCFYGLMFSAYEIVLSLGIQVTYMGGGMMGLATGAILVILLFAFGVGLHRHPQLFGEFNDKFAKDTCIQSHYYCILIVERVLTAGCLLIAIISPQGAIIVLILAVQIVMVVWKKPYAGESAWIRPFLNLLFSALIQAVYILTPMLSSNKTMSGYLPFAILGMLAVVLGYNIYYYVKQIKGVKEANAIEEEDDMMKQQFSKLEIFQPGKGLDGAKMGMLDKANMLDVSDPQDSSPSRLYNNLLSDVRGQLNKTKIAATDQLNVSLEGGINLIEDDAI